MFLPNNKSLPQDVENRILPVPETLDDVIDAVARDSEDRPAEYLQETVVPYGGE